MQTATRPMVYLAGPDVFLPNARDIGTAKIAICNDVGLTGVFPLDGEVDLTGLSAPEQARRISLANEGLMRSCDAVIANLTPFRGASMDSGTAFEIGFMRALGRPIFAYSNSISDYAERARVFRRMGLPADDFDGAEVEIEDFGLAENLMIAVAVTESGTQIVRHPAAGNPATALGGFEIAASQAAEVLLGRDLP